MTAEFNPVLDLRLELELAITPAQIWRGYTEPELLEQWFCPQPWKAVQWNLDLQPGGSFSTTMLGPNGESFPNTGTYLRVETNHRLVWTNALLPGYRPAPKLEESAVNFCFTADVQLRETANGTHYMATVMHATSQDRETHERMGFAEGWTIALNQLVVLIDSHH